MNPVLHVPTVDATASDSAMPKNGEAVLIIGRDGSTRFLTLGLSTQTILAKMVAGETLTDEEETDMLVAGKAFALCLAAGNEQIMSILEDIAANPEIIDPAKLAALSRMN